MDEHIHMAQQVLRALTKARQDAELVPTKEFPVKPGWVEERDAILAETVEASKQMKDALQLIQQARAKHRAFWAKVELDLGEYGHLRFDDSKEKAVILLLEPRGNAEQVVSPFSFNTDPMDSLDEPTIEEKK